MTNNSYIHSGSLQSLTVSEIFAKYHSQLKGFISKRVPSKEDCEDILQEVFYQLAKVNLEENPIRQMSSWLYSVARNRIIDRSRKQREEELPYYLDDGEYLLAEEINRLLPDEISSPETTLIKSLIWEELEIALSELPDDQRTIFELTELDGFSFKEISESTGISVNTLISRKRYAVMYLRKRLFDWYEEFWD
ncbi:ECF RNA polymerase sigma factor SigW [termite gut metagenome]|uniref:ECF RNA polymerase sigma factor SigW n=1 Tax=termite gut metagenome TaxID=433724 RepID=A0A5J4SVU0_9ZZZZ